MQTDNQHIIHKLTLEVNTSSVEQGYEIKDNVRSFIDAHVVPAIEQYFAGLTTSMSADEVIQLDKLELTVNTGQSGWNINGLGQAIEVEFDKAVSVTLSGLASSSPNRKMPVSKVDTHFGNVSTSMSDAPKVENLKVSTKSKHGVLAWISFLNNGTTNWFTNEMLKSGSSAQEEQLLKVIFQEIETLNKKRGLVFVIPEARKRLIGQFSDNFLISLVSMASRKSVSVNYSSVLPKQKQPIETLIRELLRGTDSPVRMLFWEVVFGMLKLDTSQATLSEEAFLLELERVFPKAVQLLETEKTAQKKNDSLKSPSKKTSQAHVDGIPGSSEAHASLIVNDVSIIGIRLLEWLHVLQSKPFSLEKYAALQASVLESKRNSADSLMLDTSKNASPSGLVKPPKKDVTQASETENSPIKKQANTESSIEPPVEKTADRPESDLKEQQLKSSEEQPSSAKERSKLSDEETEASTDPEITNLKPEESALNTKHKIRDADAHSPEDTAVQSEQAADSVSESHEATIDPDSRKALLKAGKPANADKEDENIAQAKKKSFKDEQAHLLVENAGLVILHPFLKHFFKGIGLLNEENKLTDKVLAAHVLHYVATGREHDFEQTMSFEKYLAGLDPFDSIPREITISEAIKQEAENMLKAVRENWKPLQSSSSAALRETFIQRPGKLINESPNPRLVVERKTVDVLLGQLNWTISIIRLPWLDELIFVEW